MIHRVHGFADWRAQARAELIRRTPPQSLIWQPAGDEQQFLFGSEAEAAEAPPPGNIRLPRAFIDPAKTVARHRDPDRWALLYRIAWRILFENPNLLFIETDPDIHALNVLRKAVEHDIYKMQAFVRFRRVSENGADNYVAWYRPDHHTLDANEAFFRDRFAGMRWAILTPDSSMFWNMEQIAYGPGVPRAEAPPDDQMEDLWRAYYASIYNPARLNLDAMRAQLPVRRWQDLPESRTIPELVRISRGRVEAMTATHAPAASAFIPIGADLPVLRQSVTQCKACELCGLATQPVFGEGPADAKIVLVGEQPGDGEDRTGRPFIGPAGQVLNEALKTAGIDRGSVYLTNSVKAFRFEERGKRRIHNTPRSIHIATCRPWLEAELEVIRPARIVCLGATAAQSVLGRGVRIQEERSRVYQHASGAEVRVTYHPSAVLRARDDATQRALALALAEDLTAAAA